jgi:superfamily I DNA/RNA helicase
LFYKLTIKQIIMANSDIKWSPFQSSIFDFTENGTGNAVISAVAGSGKTTTIVNALNRIPKNKSVCFVAFTKHIVAELKTRVPANTEVYTMHSFGCRSILYWLKGNYDSDKVYKLCEMLFESWEVPEEFQKGYISRVMKLVDLGRMNLVNDVNGMFNISLKHGMELLDREDSHAFQILNLVRQNRRTYDFTDMIYQPVINKLKVRQYDFVFIDECQDLSKCQQELLKLMVKPITGRFIAVGDPHQCIFGFAGADIESYDILAGMKDTKVLPLSVSYRCSKEVVKYAQRIVNHIEYSETAPEGSVRFDGKLSEVADGDFVLCRTLRPLAAVCLKFIAQHKKAYVKGADIGANLINMLKKTKKPTIKGAITVLYSDLQFIKMKIMSRGLTETEALNSSTYRNFVEKIEVIEVLSERLTKIESLIELISEIFSENKAGICCSTVHKTKGLEATNVFIIEPSIIQAPWARQEWEQEQERNIEYVAITRAKMNLTLVPESEFSVYNK